MKYLLMNLLFLIAFSISNANTLDNGLKAHYKFNNDATDELGNYDLNTISGNLNYVPSNFGGLSADFNGFTGLTSNAIFDNTHFTSTAISIWVKSSTITPSQNQAILQGAYLGFGVYIEAGTGRAGGFFDGSAANTYTSSMVLTDGKWHHIVVQSNGSVTSMYIDGVFDGSVNEQLVVGNGNSNNKLFFGLTNQNAAPYHGLVDEARIYSRELTLCEIERLYNNQIADPEVVYDFENSLFDGSPNSYHLSGTGNLNYELFAANDYAIKFDGTYSISTSNAFDNTNYTSSAISLWVKSSKIIATNQTVLQGAFLGFGVYIEANTGRIMGFFDGSAAGSYKSSMPITDGTWHHIVVQSDGSTTSMYIDGVFDGSINEPLVVGNGNANNQIYLGLTNQGLNPFTGSVNQVQIYDRTLAQCEITDLASANFFTKTKEIYLPNAKIYPNPATNSINIDLEQNHEAETITIFDALGRIVHLQQAHHNTLQHININHLSAGIYIVTIQSKNKMKSLKLFKK